VVPGNGDRPLLPEKNQQRKCINITKILITLNLCNNEMSKNALLMHTTLLQRRRRRRKIKDPATLIKTL
jgi:hypothetical protein